MPIKINGDQTQVVFEWNPDVAIQSLAVKGEDRRNGGPMSSVGIVMQAAEGGPSVAIAFITKGSLQDFIKELNDCLPLFGEEVPEGWESYPAN